MTKSDSSPVAVRRLSKTDPLTADTLIRAYQRQAAAIDSTLAPLRQDLLAIDVAMEPYRNLFRELERSFAPIQSQIDAFNATLEPLARQWLDSRGQLDLLVQQSQDLFATIEQWIQRQPRRDEQTAVTLATLATFGWYCDPEMPPSATAGFARALAQGSARGVVEDIAAHFRDRVGEIEIEICERYPSRESIVRDAFDAHRAGKYNLSIPVFLTQADGVWWDRFGIHFFSRHRGRSLRSANLDDIQSCVFEVFYRVFELSAPLWMSQSERAADFRHLNRHQVLHGEVVDYGTEYNSLKAISLLAYLSWVLNAPWD